MECQYNAGKNFQMIQSFCTTGVTHDAETPGDLKKFVMIQSFCTPEQDAIKTVSSNKLVNFSQMLLEGCKGGTLGKVT